MTLRGWPARTRPVWRGVELFRAAGRLAGTWGLWKGEEEKCSLFEYVCVFIFLAITAIGCVGAMWKDPMFTTVFFTNTLSSARGIERGARRHNRGFLRGGPAEVELSPFLFLCLQSNQIKSNHFYCHITTAQVPWWVKFLWACSRQCKKTTENLPMDRQCKKTTNNLPMDRQCKKTTNNLPMDRQCKKTTNNLPMDRQCKKTTNNLHMDRQCKKTALEHLQCSRQCKKNNSNLHMDRQCKKKKKQQQQFTYGQYIFTDCTEDNVQNTHTYTQYA